MKFSIFDKICDIMNEYDNLLNNIKQIPKTSSGYTESPENDMDNFFKFIFKNINIKKNVDGTTNGQPNEHTTEQFNGQSTEQSTEQFNGQSTEPANGQSTEPANEQSNESMYEITNQIINKSLEPESDLEPDSEETIIKEYIKKCYKKIILKSHPDKNGDKNIFIKCQEYYNTTLLIGILYLCYKLNITPPLLNDIIINRILCEIRIIQDKIIQLKKNMI